MAGPRKVNQNNLLFAILILLCITISTDTKTYINATSKKSVYKESLNQDDDCPIEILEAYLPNLKWEKNLTTTKIPHIDIKQLGANPDWDRFCVGFPYIEAPKKKIDINGNWQTVINNNLYRQYITGETCIRNVSSPCTKDIFNTNYHGTCDEVRKMVKLLTCNKNRQPVIKHEQFYYIASCVCKVGIT